MHELSIADSIIKTTKRERDNRGYGQVEAIGLRIGALSDIVPDALTFGFEALTKDTEFESTRLEIETVPVRGICKNCKNEFEVDQLLFECPACSSRDINLTQGQELEIVYFEFETTDPDSTNNDS